MPISDAELHTHVLNYESYTWPEIALESGWTLEYFEW